MARLLFPLSSFQPIGGLETPAVPNLSFATFLGDGSFNARDNTNVAPGGAAFTTTGAGPALSSNYATFTPGNCYVTPMRDVTIGTAIAHTLVFVASPGSLALASTNMSFTTTGAGTDQRIDTLNIGGVVTVRSQGGIISNGSGAVDQPFGSNVTTAWNMFAWVCVVNKLLTFYNLTAGTSAQSAAVTLPNTRPTTGQWNIGAVTSPTFPDPAKLAFALGANTEMSAADLNALAASLRVSLSARGINV